MSEQMQQCRPRSADRLQQETREFERSYKDAYKNIDEAITLFTQGKHQQSEAKFQTGIILLDKALAVNLAALSLDDATSHHYLEMQVKMRATRKEVLLHLEEYQTAVRTSDRGLNQPSIPDVPPSYDDYMRSVSSESRGGTELNGCGYAAAAAAAAAVEVGVEAKETESFEYVEEGEEAVAGQRRRASTTAKISAGAECVATGVVWGAEKISGLMGQWSASVQESEAAVTADSASMTKIDPTWQTTAKATRVVSGKAVQVSCYILDGVSKVTMSLGRRIAPHLHQQGKRAVCHFTGATEQEASEQVDGVLEVAAGAVQGISTVYVGLETAAGTIAKSLTDNTVKVVTHKYGSDAGQFTDNTMHTVGQSMSASYNMSAIGVKSIAKRAAKDTGRALVNSYRDDNTDKNSGATAGGAVTYTGTTSMTALNNNSVTQRGRTQNCTDNRSSGVQNCSENTDDIEIVKNVLVRSRSRSC